MEVEEAMNPYDAPAPEPSLTPVRNGISVAGISSCAIFLFAIYRFVVLWRRFGRVPVHRAFEALALGPLRGALETATTMFFILTLSGCILGAFGAWQRAERRETAISGLALNGLALLIVIILSSTGGP
jgi:hypothetical protein